MTAGPPTRWIAPSTPPPPRRPLFAAFTIASAGNPVMSPWTRRIRSTGELATTLSALADVRDEAADHPCQARPCCGARLEDFLVAERLAGIPRAGVRHERHTAHLEPDPPRCDALEHGRHADRMAAEAGEHPDLGRGLVRRPGQPDVDALGELDPLRGGGGVQPRPQAGTPGVGHV